MRVAGSFVRTSPIFALCLALALSAGYAQKSAAQSSPENPRQILVANAHALEARGRPDMAVQIWQQILLSDPKNAEALAGVARDYKLNGNDKEAEDALERLRAVNPNDPNIAKIEGLSNTRAQSGQLRRAGDLARQGHNDEAMKIYRQLYGDHPPEAIALAYYQTLYGTVGGKEQAIAAMRSLEQKNPGDSRYAVELGRMLSYDPKTRPEAIRILQEHPSDPNARIALRQALVWDSANPASAADLRQYLKEHPQDTAIAEQLKLNEQKLAEMNSGIARTPAEKAAFAALSDHHLDEAQKRFADLLQKDPKNSRAAAGMGFVRMQQQNFGEAVTYLSQAGENGYKSAVVENALATSRFWYAMAQASRAFEANQFDAAAQKYKDALAMRPRSAEALNGLAGVYVKEQQYQQAAAIYDQLLKLEPNNADAWRGLFLGYAQDGQSDRALALAEKFPARVKADMEKDPAYLRTLATIYYSKGRSADAQKVLSQALALPFPDNGQHLKQDTRLQYAGILMEAHRFDQAAALYTQILNEDANSLPAWMGLVSAHHELARDTASIADLEKMPPAVYESALSDPGFLSMLGAIYQKADRLDIAQSLLERCVKLQLARGVQPSLQLQMQLAGIYLQRGNTDQAYAIYRQVLKAHPERADAWKGLIATLQATNHSSEALQELAFIPPAVRKELENDPQFVEAEASIYAATGDTPHALEYMTRVQRYYAQAGKPMPPGLAIQDAWLLYNTSNDRGLYSSLMRLGARQDLTIPERQTVQTIWANWAVKRAGAAIDNNENQRAVEILEAASLAFPDNIDVKRVLAGGYLKSGQSKASLALYKSLPFDDAGVPDYQGAIGAALAANDKMQAETWLRMALNKFPNDYRILGMAAKFEQARGDIQRSADYWRAALAAMPAGSPTDRLAHDLAYPDQDTKAHKARTLADLQHLLNPDESGPNEPFQKTVKLPPLPAYGPDPYMAAAPVTPQSQQTIARQSDIPPPPIATEIPIPNTAASNTTTAPPTTPMPPVQNIAPPPPPQPLQDNRPVILVPPSGDKPQMYIPVPQASVAPPDTGSQQPSSSPSDNNAAQALPPVQTDAQLTEGSQVRPLRNAPLTLPGDSPSEASPSADVAIVKPTLSDTQYTPSAQEAATGAYSSQKQQPQQPATQPKTTTPPPATQPQQHATVKRPKKQSPAKQQSVPTLATAPSEAAPPAPPVDQTPAQTTAAPSEQQQQPPPDNTAPGNPAPGVTDQQLQQQNLPPLRGPWVRVQRQPRVLSPREEAEQQLESLESSYSGWLSGTGMVNYRSGDLGYSQLAALEAPFEFSAPVGYRLRFTFVGKPVFLDSGQADGTSVISVQEATTAGRTLVAIPQPLGTATNTGPVAGSTFTASPPAQQNAAGTGGEVQLSTPTFAIAAGYSPFGFLVANWTARVQWRPSNGPITIALTRDSVKDSQLSYAGLRDPGTASLSYPGTIWGGVMATGGNFQFARGDAMSGFYVGVGGQYLSGYNVETNSRIDGNGGAYWRVKEYPEYGILSVGTNFFAMHYANNQDAFTFGMGGYFSPQAYFLANVPLTWVGHSNTRWHYQVVGGLGVQAFQQDLTPLFPLSGQKASEIALNNAALPAITSVGANYDIRANLGYAITPHWFAEGFAGGNNARNYNAASVGFAIHYMFRIQPSTLTSPTGLFPHEGLRPFTVP
jgi:tetratricopeptide (TPR) repeat protein